MSWREAEQSYADDVIGDSVLPKLFEESVERYGDATYQRYKGGIYERSLSPDPVPPADPETFGSLSYEEVRHIVRRLAAGLHGLGVGQGDRVAIFANTRMEWAQSDLAILAAGGVVVTIYADASSDTIEYILSNSGAVGAIVEDDARAQEVRESEADLEFLVRMDGDPAGDGGVETLGEVYELGAEAFDREAYDSWIDVIAPSDLASLVYTSGTTGRPKGVKLAHWNIRSNINQIRKRYGPRPDKPGDLPRLDEETVAVSFLPLAHIFERTAGHFTMIAAGGTVAYAESPDTLQDDFQTVQPTVATSVPRVYEKIYAAIREQAQSSAIKERIFHWAVGVGEAYHLSDEPGPSLRVKRAIADRLVFRKVRDALGGDIEMLISGGGSLSPDLCALYHAMGLPVFEGYGLTETSPVVTCNPIEEPKVGTIGPPVVDLEIDLAPVELENETGEIGELLVRGPNVADGYWKQPQKTAASFDDEGWFHTGDIVRRRSDGYLEFLERSKELLVLSTGKNVPPGPIEDAFAPSEYVEQCMVVGEERKFVGALIVPNEMAIRDALSDESLPERSEDLCRHEAVIDLIQMEVDAVNEGFDTHETIKQFRLVPEEFTAENELLTPTMKKKRRNILEAFDAEVNEIYAES